MDDVELSIEGEVAFLRLRRPSHGNALRGVTFDAFRKIVLKLGDAPPRYVVVTGEGDDFCVGLDPDPKDPLYGLFEPLARTRDAHRATEMVSRLRSSVESLGRLPCPVIAAIEGRCWGAGLAIALAADLRVCSTATTFRVGEAQRGIVEGLGVLTRLGANCGPARTMDLALTGREASSVEYAALGLVTRVVAPGSALSAAIDLTQELRRLGPAARQQTLLLLRAQQARFEREVGVLETEAAARTWVAGEFLTIGGSPA